MKISRLSILFEVYYFHRESFLLLFFFVQRDIWVCDCRFGLLMNKGIQCNVRLTVLQILTDHRTVKEELFTSEPEELRI